VNTSAAGFGRLTACDQLHAISHVNGTYPELQHPHPPTPPNMPTINMNMFSAAVYSLSRKIQNKNIRLFICMYLVSFHTVKNFDCIVNGIMVELKLDQN